MDRLPAGAQVLSAGLMSREADTFSLGVILWELFNAHRPPWRQLLQQRGAQQQRGGAQQRSSSAGGEEGAAGEARGADVRGGGGDVAAGAEHGERGLLRSWAGRHCVLSPWSTLSHLHSRSACLEERRQWTPQPAAR